MGKTREIERRFPITREATGDRFVYRLGGRAVTRKRDIARFEALAIPPAWSDVRIARSSSAKVLARGVDAAGRIQTIYHPSYRRKKDREKFARLLRFARGLPALRARVDKDLSRRRLSKDRIAACAVRVIDRQFFRVGNAEYAHRHRSYGVTTLRKRHVRITSETVAFDFVGKSGTRHHRRVRDPRVARLLARLSELPGPELFRFLDGEGSIHNLESSHVNAYIGQHLGEEFSSKDFRTWGANVMAASALISSSAGEHGTQARRDAAVRQIVKDVAARLGNTPAVTRSSYIDPRILHMIEHPDVLERLRRSRARMRARGYFSVDERGTLKLLTIAARPCRAHR